ncbi:putative zinc-binding peptidase [Ramlibacter monticola]|uniref:Zinc-binding peptidase n=1 Tax=Ramlibacter monticola TaxID=1926872 RepID=A0A937CV25_9BURK|nr:putative zinc-binding peptidase [Ramlibacter monticola]MBL0394215.1 putative zinc-binding peptidase [Ramlibacter monticola]
MKTFHCQFCGHPIFFENVQCLQCGSALAFLPDRLNMSAIEEVPDGGEGLWRPRMRGRKVSGARYRLCHNHTTQNACNFAVPARDPNELCVSCRLTRVLPDLSVPENPLRWYRLEAAKRRMFYTLAKLGLVSTDPPAGSADGPIFEFLADLPGQPVMTGHAQGVITLNVAEADDAERVRRREEMHEPYRTLLGHLRHESGHFYWDRLVDEGGRVESFRQVFGDERLDYQKALQDHYARGGTVPDWQDSFVSQYATAHPWEDWAETWAHYLHMVDLLETAASYNTRLRIPGQEQEVEEVVNPLETGRPDFDTLVDQWVPLTLLVNSLNRSLGQEDAYPFALSAGALDKLRYVHDVIGETYSRVPAKDAQAQKNKDGSEAEAVGR